MRTSGAGNSLLTIAPGAGARRARGFTLLELLVVVAIIAIATAGVSFAMRDSQATQLEREGQRLAALLESARAQSRSSGVPVKVPSGSCIQYVGTKPSTAIVRQASER